MNRPAAPSQVAPTGASDAAVEFGRRFTPHMLKMTFDAGEGWRPPTIEPYGPITIEPSALVFHYGQEIFEGMKAYPGEGGAVYLFRPADHIRRLNRSAIRVCMPEVDVDAVVSALSLLVARDASALRETPGTSLYLRPTMIATESGLGVRVSRQYLLFCLLSPVGKYFASDAAAPVAIYVTEDHVRAVRGGVGDVKVGGNYAASLAAAEAARRAGCVQTLWLDAAERKYVEEVGTMNVFFVFDDVLVTPALTGTILPGITRDSVLSIAQLEGRRVEERPVALDEVLDGARSGRLTEAFGTGTAVGISAIGSFVYRGATHTIGEQTVGPVATHLRQTLSAIQHGSSPAFPEWRRPVAVSLVSRT